MPRGQASKVGDTNVSDNGYHYTRIATGWKLTHHIIAEKALGRPITADETVRFADGNRKNLSPDNIVVTTRKTSLKGRIAVLDARIMELTNERDRLQALYEKQVSSGKENVD